MESITKFVIRDKHGNVREQGGFSTVGSVFVHADGGVGEPSATSEYLDGELHITLHNFKGEGISSIEWEASAEDDGVNYLVVTTDGDNTGDANVHRFPVKNGSRGNGITAIEVTESQADAGNNVIIIKTTDNPTGVTFQVRNGNRGNGITSIEQTTTSTEDGGVNVVTVKTTDNQAGVTFQVRNGSRGPQGNSAVFDPDTGNILATLESGIGSSDVNAMTQKAMTDFVTVAEDISLTATGVITVSGKVIDTASGNPWKSSSSSESKLVPVTPGELIALSPIVGSNLRYGFLTDSATTGDAHFVPDTVYGLIDANTTQYIHVPTGAAYLYLRTKLDGNDRTPSMCARLNPIINAIPTIKQEIEDNTKQIGNLMPKVNEPLPDDNYSILSTGKFGADAQYKHTHIAVSEGETYYVEAPASGFTYIAFATAITATSGGTIPTVNGTSIVLLKYGEGKRVKIPSGCSYLLVYNSGNARPYNIRRIKNTTTIKPLLDFGAIGASDGVFSKSYRDSDGTRLATPRYIKTSDDVSVKVNTGCSLYVVYYSSDFTFLGNKASSLDAGETFSPVSDYNHAYIKIFLTTEDYKMIDIQLTGVFNDGWDVFNERPANGYKMISAVANITKPDSCSANGKELGDEPNFMPAWGLMLLPPTYTNTGKPTRLIIYCHGAAEHLNAKKSGNTWTYPSAFDTNKHVDPTYWLAEGYAVMDMDGNPFENEAHAFFPQAMDCYVAGYKWATEHYNLCRDGVFLGGRSMGAGNTLHLIRQQCPIPVIAACANLPTSLAMSKSQSAKAKGALRRGFVLPDGFAWSKGASDNKPYNNEEKQVIIDNWNKFIAWQPITSLITDMPISDEWKMDFLATCNATGVYVENQGQENERTLSRIDMLKGLHAMAKCPLKMFRCLQDPNNPIEMATGIYKTIFDNSGQIVELRTFDSDKDYTGTEYTAHYYELQDEQLRTNITTTLGEELENVPMVYIEMLQFWRRFEQ